MNRRPCALTFGAGIALLGCSGIDGLPEEPRSQGGGADATAVPVDANSDAVATVDTGPRYDATIDLDAGVDATIDAAPCVADDDSTFCTRLGKNCGTVTADDNCGTRRTVASCGVCSSFFDTCGGSWVENVCGCTSESDWAFCTRIGRACGYVAGTDNCGSPRTVTSCGGACSPDAGAADAGATDAGLLDAGMPDAATGAATAEIMATTAGMTGPGLSDCGPNGNDVCARSLLVPGGTFFRGETTNYPATVSDFRLDKYEVTVGRFRKFVDAWVAGWRPAAGSGKHTHLNGAAGLANTAGGFESGWDAAWTAYVGAPSNQGIDPTGPGATTKASWDATLNCDSPYPTWTSAVGPNETRPQNCLSWYDLHAFCMWDGGFLASEAEWEYAAAGGSEERAYPWGATAPAANAALAIYGCYYNGTGSCSGVTNIAPVGTVAAGAGRWGQLDLAGNVWEWNLDWSQSFVAPCNNCTNLAVGSLRAFRGGSFDYFASSLPAATRNNYWPAVRGSRFGGRCARPPSGGTCTAETDAAFCTRLGATCGSKSGADNCGQARTVANCGTCATGNACGAANTCVCAGGASEPSCCGGTLPSGVTCQACGLNTCSAASCDDGTAIAASLTNATLDCQYRSGTTTWSRAMSYCEELGAGWRLPSKGEAAQIASSPSVCRISLSGVWGTWTRTCSAAATAWRVSSSGNTVQTSVHNTSLGNTLCVR